MSPPSETPPCRFPAVGSSSQSLRASPGILDPRVQQRMPAKKLGVSLPCQAVPTRSSIQPLLPDPHDAPIELQKALGVRRSPIVLVVASEFGVEGFPLLVHRGMSVLLTPFGDRREAPAEPLACNALRADVAHRKRGSIALPRVGDYTDRCCPTRIATAGC
jgi:hypothetical protein